MRHNLSFWVIAACLITLASATPSHAEPTPLYSQGAFVEGLPMGGPYVPPGTLYDNEQSNNTSGLASANSSGIFTARTADSFTLPNDTCVLGRFVIERIRIQMQQVDAAAQPFGVDLYDDNGTGTAPTPASAIAPIHSFVETSRLFLGSPASGSSNLEVSFDTVGLELYGDTIYWLSGFGTDAAANATAFNNFFLASDGASGTPHIGVIIAPDAGVTTWTPVHLVIGGAPQAFSFAIDGYCYPIFLPSGSDIPTLSPMGIALLAGALGALGLFAIARRRGSG